MDEVVEIEIHTGALSGLPHRVLELEAREALFELYEVEVTLLIDEPPEARTLLGEPITLTLRTTEGRERHWHGIVWSVATQPRAQHDSVLRLTITPRARRLALGLDSRIFRNQHVPAVVDDVLRRAGLPDGAWSWDLSATLRPHTNIHQRNESDYALCRRLLAEEGLAFAVQNTTTDERIVFFDSSRGLPALAESDTLHVSARGSDRLDGVFDLREQHRVTSGQVTLRDYDARRPDRPWHASETSHGPEVYLHPGGFNDERAGQQRAARYREAHELGRRTILGASDAPWLEPGRRFRIEGHDRLELNEELLLVSVTHRCARGETERGSFAFESRFEAVPAATAYRPSPMMARPRAQGMQPAFVTTPPPLEHHSDDLGRMKVRFPWDRSGILDAESSTWCRVGQQQLPGPMVLPRVGFEVQIDCEQGDWDRPMVTGHRYNAEQLVPYGLPARAALSAWQSNTLYAGLGANELRFDDTAGVEELYFHASMNARSVVEHDAVRRITNDEQVTVGIRQALTVTEDFVAVVGGGRTTAVGRNQSLRVDASFSEGVGTDERVISSRRRLEVGGDLAENVRGDLTRTVGPIQVLGSLGALAHRTLGDSVTTVGTAWIERVGKDRTSHVRGNRTEQVAALKLIEAGSFRLDAASGFEQRFTELELKIEEDASRAAESLLRVVAQGALEVVAKTVTITASDQLTITAGACAITLASSGSVTLEGPRVNLRNAQSIGASVRVN